MPEVAFICADYLHRFNFTADGVLTGFVRSAKVEGFGYPLLADIQLGFFIFVLFQIQCTLLAVFFKRVYQMQSLSALMEVQLTTLLVELKVASGVQVELKDQQAF